jgi:hypothetical protein
VPRARKHTHAAVCCRMLPYAADTRTCQERGSTRMLPYAAVRRRMLPIRVRAKSEEAHANSDVQVY